MGCCAGRRRKAVKVGKNTRSCRRRSTSGCLALVFAVGTAKWEPVRVRLPMGVRLPMSVRLPMGVRALPMGMRALPVNLLACLSVAVV